MTRRSLIHRALVVCLLLELLAAPITAAAAQAPERSEAFVYAVTAFDGQVYQSAFVPPQVDTIYLMSGAENVLAARETLIYYWDLTNRYEPDWLAKNVFVEGRLEVRQRGSTVASLEPTDYVVQYDSASPLETRALITGPAAAEAYARFQQLQKENRDANYLYYQLQQVYQEAVEKIIASGQAVPEDEFPRPPQQPAPLTLYSSELARGYVLDLAPGRYTLTLLDSGGAPVGGSQKDLVVFAAQGEGISYTVMPETRWTRPVTSRIAGSTIYTPPGNTLYLQPFLQKKFNDLEYARMLDPQDTAARRDQERWVSYTPYRPAALAFGGQTLEMQAYKIVQLAGSGLGYEVRPFDPASMDSSSFEGFQINLDEAGGAARIALLGADGREVAGSRREVRVLYTTRAVWLYVLALLPILAGALAYFWRGRGVRRIKVEG